MKRLLVVIAVSALAATACSSDNNSDGDLAAVDETIAEDAGTQEPDIDEPAFASGGTADLAITEVVFDDHLTITNLGADAVSVDGLWLCNRPNYVPMPTALIAPGESIDISDLSISVGGGEVALYTSNSFDDSSAMLDYVAWGGGGGRASVAVDAGLWPDGDTVDAGSASISAPSGGSSAADWSS